MEPAAKTKEIRIARFRYIVRFALRLNWFISACVALLAFLLIRKYVFDIVRVSSRDMQATWSPGDALLLRKWNNRFTTNDVIAFDYPRSDSGGLKKRFVQRIFGLPGDSLAIREKVVYINGMKIQDTSSIRHNYFIKTRRILSDSAFFLRYKLDEGGQISQEGDYSYSLTFQEYWRLRKDTLVARIVRKSEKAGNYDETLFPSTPRYPWNMDHYGPIYVPAAGDTLPLDTTNLPLYLAIIAAHEKNQVEVRGDSIFVNGAHAVNYVCRKNYYFVLGDNRDNAMDSRSWGFVPETSIRGKVVRTLRRKKA